MKTLLKCHLPLHLGKYWDKDLSPEDKIKTQQWRAKIMLAAENAKWFEIDDEGTEILHKLDRQGERAVQKKRATQEEVKEYKNVVLNRIIESHLCVQVMQGKIEEPSHYISVLDVLTGWQIAEDEKRGIL